MNYFLRNAVFMLIMLTACAGLQDIAQEEVEYRQRVDEANWANCQEVYRRAGQPTFSHHIHRDHLKHKRAQAREDLIDNSCRSVLGEEWLEY